MPRIEPSPARHFAARNALPRFLTARIHRGCVSMLTATCVALISWGALSPVASAQESSFTAEQIEFFEKKIRPLLIEHCHVCHGPEEHKKNLRLDSRLAALAGGDSGRAIVPGHPEESLLVDAVRYASNLRMPPDGKLADEQIAALVEWIGQGAAWPDDLAVVPAANRSTERQLTDEDRAFWAFQPVADPQLPSVTRADWPTSALDRFILAKLEEARLSPAPRADKVKLIRRATFDLTGLPPTPEEVAQFLADDSSDAFARVVDRLLDSPQYGVRWGRHWLDVARYADSNGLDENLAYVNAFRYRDYIVHAFNSDKPYDQFLREQIAGDLLPTSEDETLARERLVATGFLTLGAKMLAEDDPVKMEMDIVDEQVDTLCTAVLGLTMGCARCHDHKFDPLLTQDYYALAGIFKSTQTMDNFSVVAVWHERSLANRQDQQVLDAYMAQVAAQRSRVDALRKSATDELLAAARPLASSYFSAASSLTSRDKVLSQAMHEALGDKSSDGLVLEAESYVRGNAKIDHEGYGQGIGVIYNAGELPNVAEYDVQLADSRLYQVELRYAAADPRPVKLFIDGRLIKSDAAKEKTGTWYPDTQTWFAELVQPLAAGSHTLRLECAGPFPHFDKLALQPCPTPEGLDPAEFFTVEEISARQGLHPGLLQQWLNYLARIADDATHPLATWTAWERATRGGQPLPTAEPQSAIEVALLTDPRPATLAELEARYVLLFERMEQARLELSTHGASPTLADAGLESLRKLVYETQGPFDLPTDPDPLLSEQTREQLRVLREELSGLEKAAPAPAPMAMAVGEGKVQNLRVHLRGSHLSLGEETPRRVPRILAGPDAPTFGDQQSGRLELANWITRGDHPLTSRVMVNRVWRWHFGQGLVASTDNFGRLGERPSHPELLDWLARRFVESGWSIKALHRAIMLSSTYQMSTAYDAQAALTDPDNRLVWRMPRRRLDAEEIRDSLLAVSGTLDATLDGSLLQSKNREYVAATSSVNPTNYDSQRRSIYLPVVRSALYDLFQAFDFAEPSVLNGNRASTTVAPQALFMMNGKLVLDATEKLAQELLDRIDLDDSGRVQRLHALAFARPASELELARARDFITRYEQGLASQSLDAAQSRLRAWQGLCKAILATNEFLFVE